MIAELALLPDRRAVRRMDLAAAVWTVVFVALGVVAGVQLWRLSRVQDTLHRVGSAVAAARHAVDLLGGVPLVGSAAHRLGATITTAAAAVSTNADQVGSATKVLAVVIGLALVLMGTAPWAAFYLPLRRARARELRSLTVLLGGDPDPLLVAHLAHAAVARVPYAQPRRLTATPYTDLAEHRYHQPAAAELGRRGLAAPRHWSDQADPHRSGPGG